MAARAGAERADIPATPEAARVLFGDRLARAERFVATLADTGIRHGLIGPREAPRLWDRHVLNCAVVHSAIPVGSVRRRVVDVGSGAGLPGMTIAIARPDLDVHLVEPLRRRASWLTDTVAQIGLTNVVVHQARAEALWDEIETPWVMARAVTDILQLAEWTLPLLSRDGSLLALKGTKARTELAEHDAALRSLGVIDAGVNEYGADLLAEPTLVLTLRIAARVDRSLFRARPTSSAGSARRRGDRPRRPRRDRSRLR
ncbi:MAG: 16S rRNA (guanine(527)-N(7))-methyltransferase RsmG [Micrococcales bacterium]|nr:16S rRNA (guanine(527)-N(7))-methyltransferase RsmG [Micrococcales bacterium]